MTIKFKGIKTDLEKALVKYDIEAKKIRAMKDGVVNSSFLIFATNGRRYVLRVYQKGNRSDVQIQN